VRFLFSGKPVSPTVMSVAPQSRVKLPDATLEKAPAKVIAKRCCRCGIDEEKLRGVALQDERCVRRTKKLLHHSILPQKYTIIIAKMHRDSCRTCVVLILLLYFNGAIGFRVQPCERFYEFEAILSTVFPNRTYAAIKYTFKSNNQLVFFVFLCGILLMLSLHKS